MAKLFLETYRNLDVFLKEYPEFSALAKPQNLDVVDFLDLDYALQQIGIDCSAAAKGLQSLKQVFALKDLRQGLFTLAGHGKGRNRRTQHRGSYVLKYDDELSANRSVVSDPLLLQRFDACVALARRLAGEAATAMREPSSQDIGAIAAYHLKLKPTDPLWEKASLGFKQIDDGLRGVIRIAANVPRGISAKGYVRFKLVSSDEASAAKTLGAPARVAKEDGYTHGGSIHIDYSVFRTDSTWSDLAIAGLILHEASHKFVLTDDHAYRHDGQKYLGLSQELAVDNADCYAMTAVCLAGAPLASEGLAKV